MIIIMIIRNSLIYAIRLARQSRGRFNRRVIIIVIITDYRDDRPVMMMIINNVAVGTLVRCLIMRHVLTLR